MNEQISIFLVDDHRIFSQSLQVFISLQERFKWKGSSAGDRRTMIDIMHQRPKVVLLDYHLNKYNGLEILKQLRQDGYTGKIVFLTMNRDKQVRMAAKTHGADGFVSKDIDGHALLEGLEQLMRKEIDYLELPIHPKGKEGNDFGMTMQEKRVADLICSGMRTDDIATKLSISVHTLYTHRRRILEKTGAVNFMDVCSKIS
jgi:DNA-binding NarL/FixJ family response regulator